MNRNNLPPRLMVGRRMTRDPYFDNWERDFDKSFKRTRSGIIAVWLGVLVGNLILWGVVIWAIIELVQWVTSK